MSGLILPPGMGAPGVDPMEERTRAFVDRLVAILTNEARIAGDSVQPFGLISACAMVMGMQQYKYNLKDSDILGITQQGIQIGRSTVAQVAASHLKQTAGQTVL